MDEIIKIHPRLINTYNVPLNFQAGNCGKTLRLFYHDSEQEIRRSRFEERFYERTAGRLENVKLELEGNRGTVEEPRASQFKNNTRPSARLNARDAKQAKR